MSPFVTPDQPRRAELSACVSCGLCLPQCPTFRLTGREAASPRGRIAALNATLDGLIELGPELDEAMSFCLGCRACEAVCPSLVPYGRILEGARAELVAQRPTASRRMRRLILGRMLPNRTAVGLVTWLAGALQRLGLASVLPGALGRALGGLRRLGPNRRSWVGHEAGPAEPELGTAALVSGCVMDAWFPAVHEATVGLLGRAGYRVVVPESQTCCGALAAHDGHASEARRLAKVNLLAFSGADVVVADAAGCSAHLKEYGHWADGGDTVAAKVADVTELVAGLIAAARLPTLGQSRGRVAVQDPCHLRHVQGITDAPRQILRAAGYTPVEIDPDGMCCGAAGIYSVLRPETSSELGKLKAAQVKAGGAGVVASANPGCEMQLRAHLGAGYRVVHPVELYWEALVAQPASSRADARR